MTADVSAAFKHHDRGHYHGLMSNHGSMMLAVCLCAANLVGCTGRETWTQVSLGQGKSCGLTTDGRVLCWGSSGVHTDTPEGHDFVQVSSGAMHVCALRGDGTVTCWGCEPITTARTDFGQCDAPDGVFTQVSAGLGFESCAIRDDGHLECWGCEDADSTPNQCTPP